jgi:hypothetical protein
VVNESVAERGGDWLAALLEHPGKPPAYFLDELLRAWRDAQRQATDAYVCWRELDPGGGHPAYLAALDREERAAEVYAQVRRRAFEASR